MICELPVITSQQRSESLAICRTSVIAARVSMFGYFVYVASFPGNV